MVHKWPLNVSDWRHIRCRVSLKLAEAYSRSTLSANQLFQLGKKDKFKAELRKRRALLSVLIYRAAAVYTRHSLSLHFCLYPCALSADTTSYSLLKFVLCRLQRLQGHLSFLLSWEGGGGLAQSQGPPVAESSAQHAAHTFSACSHTQTRWLFALTCCHHQEGWNFSLSRFGWGWVGAGAVQRGKRKKM